MWVGMQAGQDAGGGVVERRTAEGPQLGLAAAAAAASAPVSASASAATAADAMRPRAPRRRLTRPAARRGAGCLAPGGLLSSPSSSRARVRRRRMTAGCCACSSIQASPLRQPPDARGGAARGAFHAASLAWEPPAAPGGPALEGGLGAWQGAGCSAGRLVDAACLGAQRASAQPASGACFACCVPAVRSLRRPCLTEHLRSELVILDAQHPEAGPLCVLHLEHAVPSGLHGCWSPEYYGP